VTHRKTEKERQLDAGRGGRGGVGAELYDRKKAWSFINHSILSVSYCTYTHLFYTPSLFPSHLLPSQTHMKGTQSRELCATWKIPPSQKFRINSCNILFCSPPKKK
jgi:hypothetical protein